MSALLDVRDLSVAYRGDGAPVQALRSASISAARGEVVGVVGESGCGKSTLAAALIMLLAPNAMVTGRIALNGRDVLALPEPDRRKLRGAEIAMIFQDPMTSFSPVLTLGDQLLDFQHHLTASRRDKRGFALDMLRHVGIADPKACLRRYPHELSGGMRQRAAVAAALLMNPSVLVADEPTTALDVTMEAQILHLLRGLRSRTNGAIVIITHHLGVVGELCDRVYVMYAGQVVEEGPVDDIYHDARHPYTRALIACDPASLRRTGGGLPTIPGRPPGLAPPPPGCAFAPRCTMADARCHATGPPRVALAAGRTALCHKVQP